MPLSIAVPTIGQSFSSQAATVDSNFTNLSTWSNGNIADTDLASPNNSVGRVVMTSPLTCTGVSTTPRWLDSAGTNASGVSVSPGASNVYLGDEASEWAVAGKSTVAKVRASVVANAVSPAVTFTFGLYPVSSAAGTAGSIILTLGTVVAGSTVALTPASTSDATGASSQFALPTSPGVTYVFGVVAGGTQGGGSVLLGRVQLRVYNV